jgi:hypothetical protein
LLAPAAEALAATARAAMPITKVIAFFIFNTPLYFHVLKRLKSGKHPSNQLRQYYLSRSIHKTIAPFF